MPQDKDADSGPDLDRLREKMKKEQKRKKDDHKVEMASLSGEVRGYYDKSYTRNLSPANVYLIVGFRGDNQAWRYYDTFNLKGLEEFRDEHPEEYKIMFDEYLFKAHPVDKDGNFRLKAPILGDDWCYVVAAVTDKHKGLHTAPMGDDGAGKLEAIMHKDLRQATKREGIIVAAEDPEAAFPDRQYDKDPQTDPMTVPPGILSPEERDKEEKEWKELLREQKERGKSR